MGGGIPILRAIREGLAANRIQSVHGIINGTTNYMLTEMERSGESFEAVLARAQALGFAEADPSTDVDGIDAAHKLTLLAAMAFGAELTVKDIPTEGIRGIEPIDFDAATRVRLPHQAACDREDQRRRRGGLARADRGARPAHPDPGDQPAREGRRRDERGRGLRRRGRDHALLRRRRRRAADRERRGGRPHRDRAGAAARQRRAGGSARVPAARARAARAGARSAICSDAPICASPPWIARRCSRTSPACSASTGSASNP